MPARTHLAELCGSISLALAGCLAFLVPFSAPRNIDLQGLLLIVSGGFAWAGLALGDRKQFKRLGRLAGSLLVVFSVTCVVSLLVNPHLGYDLLGAPYIRLGTAGLLSCIGIGLLAARREAKRLMVELYLLIIGLTILSVPYSWGRFHSLLRIGGVFGQADIMACVVGCGLLIGLGILNLYPRQQRALLGMQAFLAVVLACTQTRAVLFLVIVLSIAWMLHNKRQKSFKSMIYLGALLLLLGGLHYALPNRLTNTAYASQSIQYRLTLQKYSLRSSQQHPFWGYGPGNLADALACSRLPARQLQASCHQGYFFNSSHNIYLDRALGLGWIGGLSFVAIVILAVYRGFRTAKELRVFAYVLVLISCYYLTNVTSLALELLLWIVLARCLVRPVKLPGTHD
jgi:O-antigen ligase